MERGTSAMGPPPGYRAPGSEEDPMPNSEDAMLSHPSASLSAWRSTSARWFDHVRSDWPWDILGFIILAAIAGATNGSKPRRAPIVKATLWEHAYPVQPNSVPAWTVPLIAIVGPIVVMLCAQLFLTRRPWREFYRLVLALLIAVAWTGAVTNCIKLPVGRPRPNFLHFCWPDGIVAWQTDDQWVGMAACSGTEPDEFEARKSFPSGHSSWSAAGLGFLTFWCLGQLKAYSGSGHAWRLLLACVPALGAIAVGVTRVVDYWHHPTDVLAGLALGFSIAYMVYRQLYTPFDDEACDLPVFLRTKQT